MIGEGAIVRLRSSGIEYVVGAELGAGTQGAVYRAAPVGAGPDVALKWYRGFAASPAQAHRLDRVVRFSRPSPAFLWPLDLVTHATEAGFGYVMPLRAPGMRSLAELMQGESAMRLRETCTAAARLSDAFLRLHSAGLCYADVSAYNVFVDPDDGTIEVCDNDNVCVDGEVPEVLGTPMFMAPEIVRREASPSAATDRHSLAVMLYMVLTRSHPLYGAKESASPVLDERSQTRLLGTEPVFVFDPVDRSNRPSPALHDNALLLWPMLPLFVQRLFTAAFTDGLREPLHGRVTENVWRTAMLRLRGLVRRCPVCGAEQFFDEDQPERACADPACRAPLVPPVALTGLHPVVLEPGAIVRPSDLARVSLDDDGPIADVVTHPVNGGLALRNRSEETWTLRRGGGVTTVAPRAAFLVRGHEQIEMGEATARIG